MNVSFLGKTILTDTHQEMFLGGDRHRKKGTFRLAATDQFVPILNVPFEYELIFICIDKDKLVRKKYSSLLKL
jgi:hypothetical protein